MQRRREAYPRGRLQADRDGSLGGKIGGCTWEIADGTLIIKSEPSSPSEEVVYAAYIGDKKYRTVREAFADTVDGCTVVILKDETFPYARSEGHAFDMADNVTISLNNHTISSTNYGSIFTGNNLTIKNGTFEAVGDKAYYALFLGDRNNGTTTEGVTLDGSTCLGGVNIYKITGVTIKNTAVSDGTTPNEFNAIYATGSTVTVESGSYQSTAGDAGVLFNVNDMTITGGNFMAKDIENKALTYYPSTLKISGGTYDVDPSASVVQGYVASKDETTGIWTVKESEL